VAAAPLNWDLYTVLKSVFQVAVLAVMAFVLYYRFIRQSYLEHLVRGLFVTLVVFSGLWIVAKVLTLTLWELFFGTAIELLLFGLIVVFQPEIRRVFLYVGQSERSGKPFASALSNQGTVVQELLEAVKFLRKSKQGALLVLEPSGVASGSYLEAGTPVDAVVSTELLLTIFHPKTPLHDGATVISHEGRVVASGVLLPLTEDPKLSWQLGTRHRAAIGLSEVSDCHCLVVSEETGNISMAYQGQLHRLANLEALKERLDVLFPTVHSHAKPFKLSELWNQENRMKYVLEQLALGGGRNEGTPPTGAAGRKQ
jgi:diadenylate cyclase